MCERGSGALVGRAAPLPDIAAPRTAGSKAARPTARVRRLDAWPAELATLRSSPCQAIALFLALLLTTVAHAQDCGLSPAAFCETFESGPAPLNDRGRGNELSRTRFSSTRFHPSLSTGDGVTFWVWEAELGFLPGEVPGCRPDVTSFLMPTRDTLVCNPSGAIGTKFLLTAVASQNYGVNAYRIRQPFDFAGRTGRIVFDADLANSLLLGYVSIVVSEDPSAAPSWDVNGRGPNPRNGVIVVLLGDEAQVHDVRDHIMATIDGDNESPVATQRGHLVRVELRLSQLGLEVWTSPPSADGIVFGPLVRRRAVTFAQPLGFSRGHVQLLAHNHATWKYGITYANLPSPLRSWNVYWDNIGFDGPALQPPREYEVPVAAVPHSFTTVTEHPAGVFTTVVHPGLSLGYVMPDGVNALGTPLVFAGVSLDHAVRARLVFNGYYQGYGTDGIRLGTGRLRYALNGNPAHLRAFTPGETAMIDTPGQTGGYNHSIDVPLSELVEGDNAVRFGTLNIESGYPNAVTNLDLVIDVDYGVVFANSFE